MSQIRNWQPTAKDYQFMRDNLLYMSPGEMAHYFKVPIGILNREKNRNGPNYRFYDERQYINSRILP